MYTTNGAPERARWQVLWVKDGRVVRHDFEHDLAEAIRVHSLAMRAGRKAVTLRCCNMAFPPPDKYADREPVVVTHPTNGKRYKGQKIIEPKQYIRRMGQLNAKGIWWCPYCMQMRRFVKRTAVMVGGVRVEGDFMACPMCGISHRMVTKYNPIATRILMDTGRIKDPHAAEKRRRRRRARQEEDDE
jgi:hypothetical protein